MIPARYKVIQAGLKKIPNFGLAKLSGNIHETTTSIKPPYLPAVFMRNER